MDEYGLGLEVDSAFISFRNSIDDYIEIEGIQ